MLFVRMSSRSDVFHICFGKREFSLIRFLNIYVERGQERGCRSSREETGSRWGHPLSSPCLTHTGATARPPERIRSAQDAKIREEWSRKAEERRKQELRVEDVVWLRSGEMAGMRARVEAVR